MNGQNKKIGIISYYYKSINFGGVLQAYALCYYLRGLGYDAEQIRYLSNPPRTPPPPFLVRLRRLTVKKLWHRLATWALRGRVRKQAAALAAFAEASVPHSAGIYTAETIRDCRGYDAYIAGSDQIWNPAWYESAYFLPFVPDGTKKIAYAPSLGCASLTEEEAALFRENLKGFSAVSVREADSVELLSPLSPVPVEWLPDPALLLAREQWDEICADRLVQKPYVFCYFLGEDLLSRRLALDFAKKRGLRVVSFLHLQGGYHEYDAGVEDKRLYGVPPGEFLSLIKYADYIFTDSFHAVVFSELYGREYAVFQRDAAGSMSSRIYSATSLFESRERFCDTDEKKTLDYIESLPPVNPDRPRPALDALRKRAREFLMENLICQEPSTPSGTQPMASPEK